MRTEPTIIHLRPFTIKEDPNTAGTDAEVRTPLQKQIYCELPPFSKYTAIAELHELFTQSPLRAKTTKNLQDDVSFRLNAVADEVGWLIEKCCKSARKRSDPHSAIASAASILRQSAELLDILHHDAKACQDKIATTAT